MKKIGALIFIILFISACSIVGVHFSLHNPTRAGKFPEATAARVLLGNQESKYRTCFDVTYYDITVKFGRDLKKDRGINGSVTMEATAVKAFDTIQLDANEQLTIKSVTAAVQEKQSGIMPAVMPLEPARWYRKHGGLFVVFPGTVRTGQKISVSIQYYSTPATAKRPPWRGGFVEKKDNMDNPWWGVTCQSEGASTWWPCKDVVNDEPESCDMHFVVPRELVAVSNGVLDAPRTARYFEEDSTMHVFNWHVSYPINLYNITFYIGKYKLVHDEYVSKVTGDTLDLNHYVLEQHYDLAKTHFTQLKDHLAVYEEFFGPYPFYRDGFKLVESPYAGMEHQTAIAYGNEFKNNFYGFDYIMLHETAHEWWGNSLTAYDLADAWLHEGFATYAECLYVEKTKGYQSYMNYLRNYRYTIINRRPLVGPYGLRYFNFRDGDIYTKGAWILHSLRETIHDDKIFFDIIKTFATRYAYKNVKSQDFIAVVNEKTGEDYNWFFQQYLYNRFVPELEYFKKDGVFYYSWNNKYSRGHFPLPVVVGDISTGVSDTLIAHGYIDTLHYRGDETPYLKSKILVKFTENNKLKREFKKQLRTNMNF